MRFINSLLFAIALSMIVSVSFSFFIDKTVLQAKYIDSLAMESNLYPVASQAIIKQLNSSTTTKQRSTIESKLNAVLSPSYVEEKTRKALFDGEKYIKEGGNLPGLDVSEVHAVFTNAGIPISDNEFPSSFTMSQNKGQNYHSSYLKYQKGRQASWILLGITLLALCAIALKRRNWTTIITLLIMSSVIQGLIYFGSTKLVKFGQTKISASTELGDFSSVLSKITVIVSTDLNKQALTLGIIFIVLAILLIVLQKTVYKAKPATT